MPRLEARDEIPGLGRRRSYGLPAVCAVWRNHSQAFSSMVRPVAVAAMSAHAGGGSNTKVDRAAVTGSTSGADAGNQVGSGVRCALSGPLAGNAAASGGA